MVSDNFCPEEETEIEIREIAIGKIFKFFMTLDLINRSYSRKMPINN